MMPCFPVLKMIQLSILDSKNGIVEVFIMSMAYYKESVIQQLNLHLLHTAQLFRNRERPSVNTSSFKVVYL
jgi:hypothetical protein